VTCWRIFFSVCLARALNSGDERRFFDRRFFPSSRSYAAMPYSKKQALTKFHSGCAR